MADPRPLEAIRSDLRGAKAFTFGENGRERFIQLLCEAKRQCPDGETWRAVLRELNVSEGDVKVVNARK